MWMTTDRIGLADLPARLRAWRRPRHVGLGIALVAACAGGCTRSFREAALQQQIEAFERTTQHLVQLSRETDAAYFAQLEYDGSEAEVYLKQSAGLRVPIKIKLGVFGNAKTTTPPLDPQALGHNSNGGAMSDRLRQPETLDDPDARSGAGRGRADATNQPHDANPR